VVSSLAEIDVLNEEPWNSGFFQGMIDAPFLQLTPGTRTGVIHDESFEAFRRALDTVKDQLREAIAREKEADEEQASRNVLKSVQKAFKEAFLTLPPEDYQWFDLHTGARKGGHEDGSRGSPGSQETAAGGEASEAQEISGGATGLGNEMAQGQGVPAVEKEFFNFPGPLFSAIISPASLVMKVNAERGFRCVPRDKSRRSIEEGVEIRWKIVEGQGRLSAESGEIVTFSAPEEPGLCLLEAVAIQEDLVESARATITVSETLIERDMSPGEKGGKGLPGYTFLRAPGELWRSRYDEKNNLIVVNNGHRDYRYAAEKHARKLKYICRLFAKELVLANFPGFDSGELLERVIELSLYAEENLR